MPTLSVNRRTVPKRRGWTYADYCRIPADRNRHELIDGRHFVNPAPSPYHQLVSARLLHQFMLHITDTGRGEVLSAPIDVHLGRGTVVQPDLVVLRRQNRSIIGDKKLTGVPDLLVEILSPSNRSYDRRRKRDRYERAGVGEYWIVDPDAHVVEQLLLRAGRYGPARLAGQQIRLRTFRGLTLDLRNVW